MFGSFTDKIRHLYKTKGVKRKREDADPASNAKSHKGTSGSQTDQKPSKQAKRMPIKGGRKGNNEEPSAKRQGGKKKDTKADAEQEQALMAKYFAAYRELGNPSTERADKEEKEVKGKKRKLESQNGDAGGIKKKKKEEDEGESGDNGADDPKSVMFTSFLATLLAHRDGFGTECFTITWPVRDTVTMSVQRRVERRLEGPMRGEWKSLMETPHVLKVAESEVQRGGIRLPQLRSFYTWLLTNKATRRYPILRQREHYILRAYNQGTSILKISRELDVPPVSAFRTLLSARGWSKGRIKEAFDHPDACDDFTERDRKQFRKAEASDLVSRNNQDRQHEMSEEFEAQIERFLKKNNIPFRRQEDLKEEQERMFAKAHSTPDFLFMAGVMINGQKVGWIEAKNFYGADLRFPAVSTRQQLAGYVSKWGPGAIVFSLGYCAELSLPSGVVKLDASILNPDEAS